VGKIKGIIFDIDGTLLDSNDAHAKAWQEACLRHGFAIDFETIRNAIGMGSDQLLPAICGVDSESKMGKALSDAKGEIFEAKYLQSLLPFPNARELAENLANRGLLLAVASSAGKEELSVFLRRIGIASLLESKTSADDIENSKPEPDVVLAALQKLSLTPNEAIMIGDTPYDISAAEKAGVSTIAVRCGGWKDRDLRGASAIYDDPSDLLAKLETSPIFFNQTESELRFQKGESDDYPRSSSTL
jgi:HAD superfamily hydrolase (TIGR01509 family)